MLKKTITYETFDGEEITEDFYFHLSKAEIAELELSQKGGLKAYVQRIIEAEDGQEIMDTFKKILRMSIGRRSEDGKRFIKSDEIADEFMQTNAYSELFVTLVTDADEAAVFVNGLLPRDMRSAKKVADLIPSNPDDIPDYMKENREPTTKELSQMSQDELARAFEYKLAKRRESETPTPSWPSSE